MTLEGSSFIVNLAEGTDGLALQKIDYILNANSEIYFVRRYKSLFSDHESLKAPSTSALALSADFAPRSEPSSSTQLWARLSLKLRRTS